LTTSALPQAHRALQPLTRQLLRTKNSADVVDRHAVRFPLTHGYEEVASVLKITRLHQKGRVLMLKLEGELLGPWVGSVRDACAVLGRRHLRLDLAAVTYVDTAGVQLLRDLVAKGAEIAACSSFVGELLQREP
jgi:hypothetical protein